MTTFWLLLVMLNLFQEIQKIYLQWFINTKIIQIVDILLANDERQGPTSSTKSIS